MEGVSFSGADTSTPISIKPPVQLSTPTPRRQPRKTAPQSSTKKPKASEKGTPIAAGIKSNGTATKASKSSRPVKGLPGRGKRLAPVAVGMVHFINAENVTLQEMAVDKLPDELEKLKLLLNEALDLRYSQEIYLEHERTPGFYIPVVDAIDYRGFLERLSLATSRQNVRAIVYSKTEGLPVTPVRTPYKPSHRVAPTPTSSTPTKITKVLTPAANAASMGTSIRSTTAPTQAAVSASANKKGTESTLKSVRIELPAATPDIRKPSLPKSSLSISVTAADVVASSDVGEVAVVPETPSAVAGMAKTSSKKDKKRKRDEEEEEETGTEAVEAVPVKAQASKKRKVADDEGISVGDAESDVSGPTSAERKANRRRRRRLQLQAEARKVAKLAQEEQQNIKLAQTLVQAPAPDNSNVSQSEDVSEAKISKRRKAKQRKRESERGDLSVTQSTEDVHMDDSAITAADVTVSSPEVPAQTATETVTSPSALDGAEPAAASQPEVATPVEPAPLESTPNGKKRRRKQKEQKKTTLSMDQPIQSSNTQPEGSANASPSPALPPAATVPTAPTEPASTSLPERITPVTGASTTDEPKSTRRERRKSTKPDQRDSSSEKAEESVSAEASTSAAGEAVVAVPAVPATSTTQDPLLVSKPAKRKARQSSAAAALAEWRAIHSQSSTADTTMVSQDSVTASQIPSSAVVQPSLAATRDDLQQDGKAVQEEPIQPQDVTDGDISKISEKIEPSREASETPSTPPASSAQRPLPPSSQQPARLPSSSPESYPSDSEESRDAWQEAHKRMRSPGSDNLEPEGDDDDDDEGTDDQREKDDDNEEDIDEPAQGTAHASPEPIASFEGPEPEQLPMEVDNIAEDEQSTSRSTTPQQSSSPTPQPMPTPEPQSETSKGELESGDTANEDKDATPQPGTLNVFSFTQDSIIPPTQNLSKTSPLSLTDLAAPASPLMPSTGVVAFQNAMEEDAAADQAAMDSVTAADDTSVTTPFAPTPANAQNGTVFSQSGSDSAASQSVSQSQNSAASPRRLRSRMRLRDGSKPENDIVKPLPLPTATPKKRGRPLKTQSQSESVDQEQLPDVTIEVAVTGPVPDGIASESPASGLTRKGRRMAASQSRIPALSSLSADALRKGRASRFSSVNGITSSNGILSQASKILAPNTQSAATSDTEEDDNDGTDSGSESDDDRQDVASSLPVGLANRVAGGTQSQKSRQSLGDMKGW